MNITNLVVFFFYYQNINKLFNLTIQYLMMIFIRLNIHKHNLDANINLNNAIIIMFPYDSDRLCSGHLFR